MRDLFDFSQNVKEPRAFRAHRLRADIGYWYNLAPDL